MHSKDRLADALTEAGLRQMAAKARDGYYHDALSPLATPAMQLAADLAAAHTGPAMALRERVLEGEFDAPSEEWQSESGDLLGDEDDEVA
jgi:hypothetical protein